MENTSPNQPVSKLAPLPVSEKQSGAGEPLPEKTVLPDECGDSLWDEILEQPGNSLPAETNSEKEGLPNKTGNENL